MANTLRVLAVHGLGDHRLSSWQTEWQEAIRTALGAEDVTLVFDVAFYDPIFDRTKISFAETIGALWKLGRSGFVRLGRRQRGISDVTARVRWTAGYVVAWVEDDGFQSDTRKFILDRVRDFKPDVILAHSLGSLITYNAFSHEDAQDQAAAKVLRDAHYVTFGSQIANPFVVGNLTHGRVQALNVRHWHHLYNEHDDVFTAEISLPGVPNFSQLLTPFDLSGAGDHSASHYLSHNVTASSLWRPLARLAAGAKLPGKVSDPWKRAPRAKARRHEKRALLVGINEYPRQKDRLEGCVNDVFTMSAVLQECDFAPEEIRTCLDDRATAEAVLSRLAWLLGDVQPGDQRVFYYSGHGARVPEYGEYFEPDRLTETLVPWDFDWSVETCIADEQIYGLYSHLPYDTHVMMIFDCCHSGGMHRQGGAKVRGVSPPDDIRHRQLKWDIKNAMWVDRDFERLNEDFSSKSKANDAFFGHNGATVRLGRAAPLRREDEAKYRRARRRSKAPVGPYLPLIIEACGEEELSYEYRHGATSYGAFTFCLASILREQKSLTFKSLVERTKARLAELQYAQVPQILGPTTKVNSKVPWKTGAAAERPPRKRVPGSSTPRLSG